MHSMQRPEVSFISSSATSWFRTPNFRRSKATDEDAGGSAYRQSNSFQRFDRTDLMNRRIGEPANRRTGESANRRTGEPAYNIPTFNTTDWHTGESAYRRIRLLRYNRTDWCTGKSAYTGESAYRRTGVSASNVQHNRSAHRRIGKPTYQIPTSQQNRLVHWRSGVPEIGVHRRIDYQQIGVSNSNVQHNRNDYHQSAYQIPTSNTTNGYTGESAYTGESITSKSAYQIQTFHTTD